MEAKLAKKDAAAEKKAEKKVGKASSDRQRRVKDATTLQQSTSTIAWKGHALQKERYR